MSIADYSGVCYAEVYFSSYYWVRKYVVEVKNSASGLFADYYVMDDFVTNNVESRYISMQVVCDSPTKS